MKAILYCTLFTLGLFVGPSYAQGTQGKKAADASNAAANDAIRSSPAYAEILLRRTELTSELEALLTEYTEEYPKVQQTRYTILVLQRENDRISKVKPTEAGKLTLALGKLILHKTHLETELWILLKTYKDDHPDVKRAKRRVEVYEAAIREVLG